MAKHSVGDAVRHSAYGPGKITAVGVKIETPPPFDAIALDGEYWNLHARMKQIESIKAKGTAPYPVDVYTVTHDNGRVEEYGELGIDKLKSRV